MTPEDLVAYCDGRPSRAAKALDTTTANVCGWLARGTIPKARQYEIQLKLGGALIADAFDESRDYVAEVKGESVSETQGEVTA